MEYAFGLSDEVYLLGRDPGQFSNAGSKAGRVPRIILDSERSRFPDRIA
ncbi:MAG: hypothetical protein H5T33_04930 [Candidatus Methanosuratus sp.]|nr:hypothetical protein [Candidatus Methanosuratincola sp.]